MLTSRNGSSLVIDWLSNQTLEHNGALACFYFDFTARSEQSATSMLGSLLMQLVSGMESIPEEISRAFQEYRNIIGGRKLQLTDVVKMLQTITSRQHTFMCIDGLDECAGMERVRLLNSLRQILEKSPGTRIFVTGRQHIRAEVEKRLAGRMISVSICPRKDDIITYLHFRLQVDETPDAMDRSLKAEILEKISGNMSEM